MQRNAESRKVFQRKKNPLSFSGFQEKGISKGELENISRVIPLDELINRESKRFKDRGMQFMVFDIEEELLEDSLLMKTPVDRNDKLATVGYNPEVWKKWLNE